MNNQHHSVSIIIPAYNEGEGLGMVLNNIIISEPFLFISKDDQRNFIYEQKKYINMKFLKKINLCPLPFTQKYRTSLNLYGVN